MTYHLLDHCNRRNAAELARTDLDARALGTLEWVPPTGLMWGPGDWRSPHSLGMQLLHGTRGHKISCGAVMDADEYDVREFGTATFSRNNYNVVRPFDERHAANVAAGHDGKGANPHDTKRTLSEPHEPGDEVHYKLKPENMEFVRHTPPNHGHDAKCGCFFFAPNWDLSLVEPESMTAMVLSSGRRVIVHSASTGLVSPQDCPDCSGTGRIICDDERAGRVSPSHAAGGYAEWQRENWGRQWSELARQIDPNYGRGTFQVPPELAGIYATDDEPTATEHRDENFVPP